MAILHRAPWVLPISAPPVVDGAVMVENGMIVAVGPYRHLRHGEHARLVEHEGRILLPALLNCHCHLELSGCAAMTDREVAPAHMPAWITELLALRASRSGEDDTSWPAPSWRANMLTVSLCWWISAMVCGLPPPAMT